VSDAPPIAAALRRRIELDPWAKALGIEFLDVRRGRCRLRLQLQSHIKQGRRAGFYQLSVATEDGRTVASAQAVAHRTSP
jgi:acyl-coenzyme A thioesterase PaaI-like protein